MHPKSLEAVKAVTVTVVIGCVVVVDALFSIKRQRHHITFELVFVIVVVGVAPVSNPKPYILNP
jgi:uncharacterized membrane protein